MVNVGEVINEMVATAAGSFLDFQPPAGQMFFLLGVGSSMNNALDYLPDLSYGLTDGTDYSKMYHNGGLTTLPFLLQNIGLTNTRYLRIENLNGSPALLSYSVLRIA